MSKEIDEVNNHWRESEGQSPPRNGRKSNDGMDTVGELGC